MKRLLLDARSGISGDMFCGALLDILNDDASVLRELKKLRLNEFSIAIHTVSKQGVRAKKFDVLLQESHAHEHTHEHAHKHTHTHANAPERTLKDINALIDKSTLSPAVKTLSKRIFLTLGRAEAKAHAVPIEQVHFHEVGAVDSIVDIVTASILITTLGITEVVCGSLTEGHGTVHIDHGAVELPVPAVRELLGDTPLNIINIAKECITPTGAAILKTLRTRFVDAVDLERTTVGIGAGTRDLPFPNVLRAAIASDGHIDRKVLIETHIDDMTPEMIPYLVDTLLTHGAVDAFAQPCVMKKQRVGTVLSVLCEPSRKEAMIETLFKETSTFGVRVRLIERVILKREMQNISTPHGVIPVKIGSYKGKIMHTKPEFDEVRKRAEAEHIPLKKLYASLTASLPQKTKKKKD